MVTPNNEAPALPAGGMTPEERLDALVEVLAEGIMCLGDKGQLERFAAGEDDGAESGECALTSGANDAIRSCGARAASNGGETNRGEHGDE